MGSRFSRLASRRRFVVAGGSAVVATGLLAVPAGCRGKIYPGTLIFDSLDLGGMTRAQAAALVDRQLAPLRTTAITFRHGNRTWKASLADLGATIDVNAMLDTAEARGRSAGFVARYTTWLDTHHTDVIATPITVDTPVLRDYLHQIATEIAIAPTNASLVQSGATLGIEADRPGLALDVALTEQRVRTLLADLTPAVLEVPTAAVAPSVTAADLAAYRDAAAALIADPVTIVDGTTGESWPVEPEDLAQALVLPSGTSDPAAHGPTLDPTLLRDTVIPIAESRWSAPINATVGWDGAPFIISAATSGRKVDADALAVAVAQAASTESRVATIPDTAIPAAISHETLPTLGLDAVIGGGSSSFAGSSGERSENVRVAADHVTGTLIAPGEQFSFNAALGPISVENGYVEGRIIKGDWYASDLGGGVCQVSTTVYRAALLAGMRFDEWHAHSFRVSFYELDGWSPGIDAAIYQPNTPDEWELDLSFTNTSGAWMLLQMSADADHLSAQLIGTPDGIAVSIDTPTLGDPLPPPTPQERATDTLPLGQRAKLQEAAPGVVVTLTRTFSKDGTVVDQDTFVSEYAAQPEIWQVGTGTDGATG